MAWAFPEKDLAVVFMTQSRGTTASFNLEKAIHGILFDPTSEEQVLAEEHKKYIGTYIDTFGPFGYEEVTVEERKNSLRLNIPSQMAFDL